MAVRGILKQLIEIFESDDATAVGGVDPEALHVIDERLVVTNGTSVYAAGDGKIQYDKIYSATRSVTSGTPVTLSLADGSLKDKFGNDFDPAKLCFLRVKNLSESGTISIGAATNPVAIFGAPANDVAPAFPLGKFELDIPLGLAMSAGVSDELKLAASAGTIEVEVLVLGRSV